ncbi:MAG: LysR substrate-binding domain-containing protein [Acidimicrobiales bacterium]
MRVQDVRYALTVAAEQNLTRAAAIEHVSVPTMSEAIRRVEKELGVTLFDRSNRGMVLSPAGRSLHSQLRGVAAASAELESHARTLGRTADDTIRVGTLFGFGSVALDRIGAGGVSAYGSTQIEIGVYDWTDPTAGLRAGETDAAILIGPTEIDADLDSRVFGTEDRVAVISAHHHLSSRKTVTLADLDDAGWLNVHVSDRVWRAFWTSDEQRGGPPPRADRLFCNSPQEAAIALRKGCGVVTSIREVAERFSIGHDAFLPLDGVPPVPIRLAQRSDAAVNGFDALFKSLAPHLPTPPGTRAILSAPPT